VTLDWPSTGPHDPLHATKHAKALKRARTFCLSLPHAAEKISRGHMPIFTSSSKNFAIVARGESRPSLWIAAAPGAQEVLAAAEPERYFRPPYVGGRGWVGAWLDVDVDWSAVEELLREGHALVAPAKGARGTRSAGNKKAARRRL
jgi:predicted DNA-binding protein (MmcQ/YjbR family)